ncbi:MAG: alpha/beta fold hydrolase [Halobaculum sp.]
MSTWKLRSQFESFHSLVRATNSPLLEQDDLPDVTEPTLVTVGRHDWITPVAASEEIADLLPNASLRIFEESGHNPHLDQSDSWLAEARAFLNRIGHR